MYPLLKMPKTAHLYKEGSSFKKVMMLYRFDKKLRLLMFNEIEKIEIARKMLANGMDAATVMEITGLSESQLQQLKG